MASLRTLIERHEVYDPGEKRFLTLLQQAGVLGRLNEKDAALVFAAHREGSGVTNDALAERQAEEQVEARREERRGSQTTGREALPKNSRDPDGRRLLILARLAARTAAQDPEVQRSREAYFGTPEGRVSWRKAGELLAQVARGGGRLKLVNFVRRTGRVIARRYEWTERQAALFLLAGFAPVPQTIRTSVTVNVAAGPRATITVTAPPFVAHQAVAAAFTAAQRRLLGHRRPRRISQANLDLFDHVSPRMAKFRRTLAKRRLAVAGSSSEEVLAAIRERQPTERELRDLWRSLREACPDELRRDSPTRMRRDYEATERRLLPASYVRAITPARRPGPSGAPARRSRTA